MSLPFLSLGLIVFALVFFVVGIFRVVEFTSLEMGKALTRVLIVLHAIGCGLFSAALIIQALDLNYKKITLVGALLGGSLVLLFPAHIYIGIKRRIKLRDSQEP